MKNTIIRTIKSMLRNIGTFIINKNKYIKENWLGILLHGILKLLICIIVLCFTGDLNTARFDDGSPENINQNQNQSMTRNDNSPWDYPANLTREQAMAHLYRYIGPQANASDPVLSKVAAQAATFLGCPQLEREYYSSKTYLRSLDWEDNLTPGLSLPRHSQCLTEEEYKQVIDRVVKPGGAFATQIEFKTGNRYLQYVGPNSKHTNETKASWELVKALAENPKR